jgi:hypothetical protein
LRSRRCGLPLLQTPWLRIVRPDVRQSISGTTVVGVLRQAGEWRERRHWLEVEKTKPHVGGVRTTAAIDHHARRDVLTPLHAGHPAILAGKGLEGGIELVPASTCPGDAGDTE